MLLAQLLLARQLRSDIDGLMTEVDKPWFSTALASELPLLHANVKQLIGWLA
jgi:hypothetical protein